MQRGAAALAESKRRSRFIATFSVGAVYEKHPNINILKAARTCRRSQTCKRALCQARGACANAGRGRGFGVQRTMFALGVFDHTATAMWRGPGVRTMCTPRQSTGDGTLPKADALHLY